MLFWYIVFCLDLLFIFHCTAIFAKQSIFLSNMHTRTFFFDTYRVFKPEICADDIARVKIDDAKSAAAFKLLEPGYDRRKIIVYKCLGSQKNSYIVFIKDAEGNYYIVKQEKIGSLKKQFQAVCEMLSAYMAEIAGVPAHYVRILPIGMSFPGKFIKNRTATLHTLVPGFGINDLLVGPYCKLDIKQNNDVASGLPFEDMGLNRRVIDNMTLHPFLPFIVALDTFIGNRDRNRRNLLYDPHSNSFSAIDMSLIYDTYKGKILLAQLSCEQVERMILDKEVFDEKELEALRKYQQTLSTLIDYFTPKKIYTLLHKFALDAGLKSNDFFSSTEVFTMIREYKGRIKESDSQIKKLIELLSILIAGATV